MISNPSFDEPVCGEPGRQMFFNYVGRYFAATPRLRPLPIGTLCLRCGATNRQLWMTSSNEPSCLAQQTITRKRKGRTSADEPAIPAETSSGMTSMGDGSMVVAGPHIARIITKVLPDTMPPPSLDIIFCGDGRIRREILSLLQHPPEPPFVVIVFEQKAIFTTTITIDRSQIFVCGPNPLVINRSRLRRLLAIAQRIGTKEFFKLMALRNRLAGGGGSKWNAKQFENDQTSLLAIRAKGSISPSEFRTLPDPSSSEAGLLNRLL